MVETAVIQVDGADHGLFVVADKDLRVDKAGRIFVDLYPRPDQPPVMGLGQGKGQLLVRDARQDQLDVDPALRGVL